MTDLSELAAGHILANTARLSNCIVQLGLFAVAMITATTVLHVPAELMINIRVDNICWWAVPVGLLLIALGFCLMESVEFFLAPWILLVLLAAFGAQLGGHALGSAAIGGFSGQSPRASVPPSSNVCGHNRYDSYFSCWRSGCWLLVASDSSA